MRGGCLTNAAAPIASCARVVQSPRKLWPVDGPRCKRISLRLRVSLRILIRATSVVLDFVPLTTERLIKLIRRLGISARRVAGQLPTLLIFLLPVCKPGHCAILTELNHRMSRK